MTEEFMDESILDKKNKISFSEIEREIETEIDNILKEDEDSSENIDLRHIMRSRNLSNLELKLLTEGVLGKGIGEIEKFKKNLHIKENLKLIERGARKLLKFLNDTGDKKTMSKLQKIISEKKYIKNGELIENELKSTIQETLGIDDEIMEEFYKIAKNKYENNELEDTGDILLFIMFLNPILYEPYVLLGITEETKKNNESAAIPAEIYEEN